MADEPKDPKIEFQRSRSHEASKAAYDLCKVIAQSCLLINGGAATAVLALLAKDKVDQSILTYVPWGLGFYAFGVVISAVMLFCVMMMADYWNYYWYYLAYYNSQEDAQASEQVANRWHLAMYLVFALAIACFASGSAIVAFGMAKSQPTNQTIQHLLPK